MVHFERFAVAAHKGHAGDAAAIALKERCERSLIENFAHIFHQIGTVTARTTVGTMRNIDCQTYFARDLLKNNIVIGKFHT